MGNTPMHFAVAVNNLQLVKLLDDNGADATIKNLEEECPIEIAQRDELKEIVAHYMSTHKYKNFKFDSIV
jgi:ankyrin repeat protein